MKFLNAEVYTPEVKKFGEGVIYFRSTNGEDWYESYGKFTKKYKLCIDPVTSEIHSVAEDAGRLYPAGFTVVEVSTLPDGFSIDGSWKFSNGKVVKSKDQASTKTTYEAINTKTRDKLLGNAMNIIKTLEFIVESGTALDRDKKMLEEYKSYCTNLYRVDLTQNPDEIAWSIKP